jgi:cardiolipin synthase
MGSAADLTGAGGDRRGRDLVRQLANQAFSRASGAPLREGNHVRLLKDASENYPAWLAAIAAARRTVHFEMYILHEDAQGELFANALLKKAADGVAVRLLYDCWAGSGRRPGASGTGFAREASRSGATTPRASTVRSDG